MDSTKEADSTAGIIMDALLAAAAFSVWSGIQVPIGKMSEHPRGMAWPHACSSFKLL
jgi:hypothetical protein